jgi:NADH-quinone oxidoreductase subunit C
VSLDSRNEKLLTLLADKLGSYIIESRLTIMHAEVRIKRDDIAAFFRLLKLDKDLSFNMLLSVTAVDWLDQKNDRFELVYHLLSLQHQYRLRVKTWIPDEDPTAQSVSDLWEAANLLERETWDMYGITFKDHPDLRRIMMYDEFVGYPLRKDYPVQGKQPRIKLRFPEVRNTAVDMVRPNLVQIRSRKSTTPNTEER